MNGSSAGDTSGANGTTAAHEATTAPTTDFESIVEGSATVLFKRGEVFYNPVQHFNRDMSVAVIRLYAETVKREYEVKQRKQEEKLQAKLAAAALNPSDAKTDIYIPPATGPWPGIRLIECFAASGLRSLRYAMELPAGHVQHVYANDLDSSAIEAIRRNIAHNQQLLQQKAAVVADGSSQQQPVGLTKIIEASHNDATVLLFSHRPNLLHPLSTPPVDVIDLDPYGTASPFMDTAIQAVSEGGLLCVTCTDKAVLSGKNSETCFTKYGSMSLRAGYHAEQAARILLAFCDTTAARHKRYIVPLVSLSVDFYVRVFIRVYTSAGQSKLAASKQSMVYQCSGCSTYHLQPLARATQVGQNIKFSLAQSTVSGTHCSQCQSVFHAGGPIYHAPIHSVEFVEQLQAHVKSEPQLYVTHPRMSAVINVIQSELDQPLYYVLPDLCQNFKVKQPKSAVLRSALLAADYEVSGSHCHPDGLKTNAPSDVVFDVMRAYTAENKPKRAVQATSNDDAAATEVAPEQPTSAESVQPNKPTSSMTVAERLMLRPVVGSYDFTKQVEGSDTRSKTTGVARFLPNPHANFGPLSVASSLTAKRMADESVEDAMVAKRRANQGKRQKKRKICLRYQKGECPYNETNCKYAHTIQEQPASDNGSMQVADDQEAATADGSVEPEQ